MGYSFFWRLPLLRVCDGAMGGALILPLPFTRTCLRTFSLYFSLRRLQAARAYAECGLVRFSSFCRQMEAGETSREEGLGAGSFTRSQAFGGWPLHTCYSSPPIVGVISLSLSEPESKLASSQASSNTH